MLANVAGRVITDSWKILLEEHVYAADALQVSSCKNSMCDLFVSADRNLLAKARSQGLKALDPERDEKSPRSL